MSRFSIHESFIESLEKKLTAIRKKCEKYGCEFYYNRIGEEFRDVEDSEGNIHHAKFYIVDVLGEIQHTGWTVVGVLEPTDSGNIIRDYLSTYSIPERFYTSSTICEHCKTRRSRKDVFILYNAELDEWKQVGRSCLSEFTHGLSAEFVADVMSCLDAFAEAETRNSIQWGSCKEYHPVKDILLYAVESVKHFGYTRADERDSTASRTFEFYCYLEDIPACRISRLDKLKADIAATNFRARTQANSTRVDDMIAWILSEDATGNNYIHNLQTLVKNDYVEFSHIRILVSLVYAYQRHIKDEEYKAERAARVSAEANSKHIGEIKDKLTLEVAFAQFVTSFDTQFGTTAIYKFLDKDGNVFIWYTSCAIEVDNVSKLTGTVKEHNEYNGVKQTVLTRCKVS